MVCICSCCCLVLFLLLLSCKCWLAQSVSSPFCPTSFLLPPRYTAPFAELFAPPAVSPFCCCCSVSGSGFGFFHLFQLRCILCFLLHAYICIHLYIYRHIHVYVLLLLLLRQQQKRCTVAVASLCVFKHEIRASTAPQLPLYPFPSVLLCAAPASSCTLSRNKCCFCLSLFLFHSL